MRILIITGGSSSERKISLISAKTLNEALKATGHETTVFDFKNGYPALKKILGRYDVVFPVMHGKEGEDGTLYHFLKAAKKRYVGSDPKGAKIATDKILFKKYCDAHRIKTAPWKMIVRGKDDIVKFGFPCVLKAANGGSSHEVVPLFSKNDISASRVKKILKLNDRFYVESFLKGTEVTVGILKGRALPVLEIVPPGDGWFDYRNKYSGRTKEIPFAPSVPIKMQRRVQKIALTVHKNLKLGSYSRIDFIIQDGEPFILEANTPGGVGMTSESLYPRAAKAMGYSYEKVVDLIARAA